MRAETEQSIAKAAINGEKYDESCKEVLKHREIIAPILKYVAKEFKDCTQEEIIRCIDADSIKDAVPVGDLPAEVGNLGTEMSSVFEKTIHYDIHFKVRNPKLSGESISVMLHVDLEVQNDYRPTNPRYPIIKRAIYYTARGISAQLGNLTNQTNYAALEKVYSIWICNENIPKDLQNTVTRYTLKKEDVIGCTNEPEEDYDLLEIVLVRRGDEPADSEIFRYLQSLFESDLAKIREYVDIPTDSEVEREIVHMTGLGESLYNKAYNKAYKKACEELHDTISKTVAIKLIKKNYMRNGDVDNALADLQEELAISYEEAKEIFDSEIMNDNQ